MRRPAAFWLGALAGLTVLDVWAARNDVEGDSLSEVARALLRTETPAGRAVLIGGWAGLSAWLIPHLLHHHPIPKETPSWPSA